jgi:hypothetical protein
MGHMQNQPVGFMKLFAPLMGLDDGQAARTGSQGPAE